MSQARQIANNHEPEEIVAMFPDQVEAVLEKAKENDRHAFAAAIREARAVAREEVDHV